MQEIISANSAAFYSPRIFQKKGNNIPVYTKLTSATDFVSKLIVALNWLIVNYINNVACYILQQATLFICLNYRVFSATIRLCRIFRCTDATRIALFLVQRCRY